MIGILCVINEAGTTTVLLKHSFQLGKLSTVRPDTRYFYNLLFATKKICQ